MAMAQDSTLQYTSAEETQAEAWEYDAAEETQGVAQEGVSAGVETPEGGEENRLYALWTRIYNGESLTQQEWREFYLNLNEIKQDLDNTDWAGLEARSSVNLIELKNIQKEHPTFMQRLEEAIQQKPLILKQQERVSLNDLLMRDNQTFYSVERREEAKQQLDDAQETERYYYQVQTMGAIYYEMDPEEMNRCVDRAKLIWNNLKNDPEFEQQVQQFNHSETAEEKVAACQNLAKLMGRAMEPFHDFSGLEIIPYDDPGRDGVTPFNAYVDPSNDKAVYLNTNPVVMDMNTTGTFIGLLAHEMTHLTQATRKKNPEAYQDSPYFGQEFTETLQVADMVYETPMTLADRRAYLNSVGKDVGNDMNLEDGTYRYSPAEQEAYLVGNLVTSAAQNWLMERGYYQEATVGCNYEKDANAGAPYTNFQEAVALMGEKPVDIDYYRQIAYADFENNYAGDGSGYYNDGNGGEYEDGGNGYYYDDTATGYEGQEDTPVQDDGAVDETTEVQLADNGASRSSPLFQKQAMPPDMSVLTSLKVFSQNEQRKEDKGQEQSLPSVEEAKLFGAQIAPPTKDALTALQGGTKEGSKAESQVETPAESKEADGLKTASQIVAPVVPKTVDMEEAPQIEAPVVPREISSLSFAEPTQSMSSVSASLNNTR